MRIYARYECKTIEETRITYFKQLQGATLKSFKAEASTPDLLNFTITRRINGYKQKENGTSTTGLIGKYLDPTIKYGFKKDSGLLRTSGSF
jgi:hypothetical protein